MTKNLFNKERKEQLHFIFSIQIYETGLIISCITFYISEDLLKISVFCVH